VDEVQIDHYFFLFFISNPDCECPVLAAALERTVLLNFDSVTRLRNMQDQKLAEIIAVKLRRFSQKLSFIQGRETVLKNYF